MTSTRRLVLGALTAIVVGPALAQPLPRLPRVGILLFGNAPSGTDPDPAQGLTLGLRELGYVEGQNIVVERRYAGNRHDRLVALAAELVALKVAVIVAAGVAPREAASHETATIPIVAIAGADPVREGWAKSLAQPGGNMTGLTVTFPELDLKRLELLRQAFPEIARVAVMIDPGELIDPRKIVADVEAGARQIGIDVQVLEIRRPQEFEAAFGAARQHRAQALYAIATNNVAAHRSRLAALAANDRLPSISEFALMAQAGFLMTYGADLDDLGRRSIAYVDKILKGSRPGDLPIERPTKFQLTINLKTAKALGLTLPRSLLSRADEVLQ